MKKALLAAAEALAQASACLKQAAENQEFNIADLGEEQLNTIASLALVKRDNDLKEMKEKIEEVEDAVENSLPSKINDLEYELEDVKRSIPDIDDDAIEAHNSRLEDLESQVSDLESEKATEDYVDEIRADLEREIEEIRDSVEPAVELAGAVANHFAPAKPEPEAETTPVGPNGHGTTAPATA